MRTSLGELVVRPFRDDDLDDVLDLLRASLAGGPTGERTRRFFRWKHLENPFGASVALVAEIDGRVVGLRTFMRWTFRARGEEVRAVRAVDTATHPDFQGRGIFRALTLEALRTVQRDTHVVFNTPNTQSLPGYLKMGWERVGRVPVAIRPVRLWRFARGIPGVERGQAAGRLPGCSLPPAGLVLRDGDLADLVEGAGVDAGRLTTAIDVSYLRWRYADAPGLDYRAIARWEGGELAGVAIGRPRKRGPLDEFTLTELIVRDGDHRTARQLLREVAKAGTDHVAAHLARGTVASAAGRRSGYLRVPGRGIDLVTRPLVPMDPDPRRRGSWQLSLGDLELF